ncbi:MAG: bifunctional homocysteine S-methyltransferase/methylenetetrahydrofolate reductase [Oscillospiraceae bacterium]|nr:bifunctional homocysteine S-methyltransferase/methylenetetrahydrofolate reductase [Oscillospiraceae bacterium]
MDIREMLKTAPLLFDGAMGTYFSQKVRAHGGSCELANLNEPETVAEIHREYLSAGAQAIKSNTFAANRPAMNGDEALVRRVISAGWQLAQREAESAEAFAFADIGPVSGLDGGSAADEYCWLADRFLDEGAVNFLFETQSSARGLAEAAEHIRARRPEAFIIVSFAVQPDGFTREGEFASELLAEMRKSGAADAVGFNCVCGARHMLELARTLDSGGLPLSLMPNAGYPVVRGSRTFYDGDPAYFAAQLAEMAAEGAAILGGCCGTTPAHIERTRQALSGSRPAPASARVALEKTAEPPESPFWQKLTRGERVTAVELDSPADASIEKFMHGARELQSAGVDLLTIADCPIARARMDSSLLACKVYRELGMEPLPHMTCRDRNLNASKALLLGLSAEGVRNVLLVTGDPVPTAERDEVKSVYQFNSRKLAAFVASLGEQSLAAPFHIFGALNVNARNFDIQLRLAKEKLERGMVGFLTQPVLTHEAFENLRRAKRELPSAYILGGIIPIVSARNARFMDSEINGINVDPRLTEMYEGLDRAEAEELAVKISAEIARRIAPAVDGYYLMTPFQRTGLITRILAQMRREGLV